MKYISDTAAGRRNFDSEALSGVFGQWGPLRPIVHRPEKQTFEMPQFSAETMRPGNLKSRKRAASERPTSNCSRHKCSVCGQMDHTAKGKKGSNGCIHVRPLGRRVSETSWGHLVSLPLLPVGGTLQPLSASIPKHIRLLLLTGQTPTSFIACVPYQDILLQPEATIFVTLDTVAKWSKSGKSKAQLVIIAHATQSVDDQELDNSAEMYGAASPTQSEADNLMKEVEASGHSEGDGKYIQCSLITCRKWRHMYDDVWAAWNVQRKQFECDDIEDEKCSDNCEESGPCKCVCDTCAQVGVSCKCEDDEI
jgi:hypothetical protein